MASTYYDSAGKEVVNGNIAYADDLNDINSAVDTAFQQVEVDLSTISTNQSYYADLAEKWAENPEDSAVTTGKYSALHWAAKAEDDKVATAADRIQTGLDRTQTGADRVQTGLDKVATAADRVQTGLDKVATAADRVQTGLDATAASDSADAAAASAALFPTLGAGDQGKYLKVSTPYTNGIETATLDLSAYAPLSSPTLTGTPAAPTASAGTNTTQIATTAFVQTASLAPKAVQVFTSSGTYTKTSGARIAIVEVVGGGGGGGGAPRGSGGSGGGYARKRIDLSSVTTETVTVGTGGSGGTSGNNGAAGGTSSFGSHCSATGGGRGTTSEGTSDNPGTGTGGDINIPGQKGHDTSFGGGSSFFGFGGYHSGATPLPGGGYGSGGSGTYDSSSSTGGNGAGGIVIVTEY